MMLRNLPSIYVYGLKAQISDGHVRRLVNAGRREQALGPAEEAVTIRRRLAEANPAAYLPGLAASLWAYARVCANIKDNLPEALNAITEAIGIYQPLTEQLPQRFAGQLFSAYRTLAEVLEGLGRTGEADDLRRQLDQAFTGTQEGVSVDFRKVPSVKVIGNLAT